MIVSRIVLVKYFYEKQYVFYKYITGYGFDFEDVIQDCCLKILDAKNEMKDDGRKMGYLWAVVKNYCIGKYYYQKRHPELVDISGMNFQQEENAFPELLEMVVKSNLTEEQKNIIYKHYWEGLSYKELSKELDLFPSTLRGKFFRAKKKLIQIYCLK